jgi:uncharacterized SAM-binding protein YcdF (DUF218 family)
VIRRLIGLAALAYLLGFIAFMLTLPRPAASGPTDGIVVLTGGAGRIDRGLTLLGAHQARRMLVSGVGRGTGVRALVRTYGNGALFACCVDLGRAAIDTRSNADETAQWVKRHGYRSVRLVTSDWHMPRARLELAQELGPGVTIVEDGVSSQPALGLLIMEYSKLIVRQVAIWLGRG